MQLSHRSGNHYTFFWLQQLTIKTCCNLINWQNFVLLVLFVTFLPHFPISRVHICYFLPVSCNRVAASSFLAWTGLINRITCQSYRTQNKKAVLWYLAFTAGRDHALYRSLLIIYPERPSIFHPAPSPLRNGKTRMRFIILWSAYGRYADSRSQPHWRGVREVDRQGKFLARYFSRARLGREAGTQPGGRKHTHLRIRVCALAHSRTLPRSRTLARQSWFFFCFFPPALPSRRSCSTATAEGNPCLNGSQEKIGFHFESELSKTEIFFFVLLFSFWRLAWLPNALWLHRKQRQLWIEAVIRHVSQCLFFFYISWGQRHVSIFISECVDWMSKGREKGLHVGGKVALFRSLRET